MRLRLAFLLATLGGFVSLSYEILWIRLYAFLTWGHASSFGVLLGAYLAGLAVGSFLARRWCRRGGAELRSLALFVFAANVVGFLLVPLVAELARHGLSRAMLGAVAVAAGMLGTVLPLVAHFGIEPDERAGSRLSYLYLGNIVGAAAGSLLTGFVLMDVWPLRGIAVFLALSGFAMSAAAAVLARRRGVLAAVGGGAVAVLLLAGPLFDGVYAKMLLGEEYRPGFRFRTVIENRSGVILVTPDGTVHGDGVYDGRFNVDPVRDTNGIFRVYAVGAFRAPRNVLVVGLGSGSWAQVIANHPSVERVVVVEINPGYIELLGTDPVVRSLRSNPKVEFVVDDGRRWLQRTEEAFDLIVQNTTYHFRAHATNLLSREYFELCRTRLREGGAMLFNTTRSEDAMKTGLAVFPHAWLFDNCMLVSDAPLVPDRPAYRKLLERYAIDGRPVIGPGDREALERLVDDDRWHDRAAIEARVRGATVITDDNMAAEYGTR